MKNLISYRGGAENAEEKFLIKKCSELRELCVSAVKRNSDILTAEARRAQRKES
jgi:hypothetical protein